MALNNTTLHSDVINSSVRLINEKVLIVQVLVMVFLYINSLLIFTFFKKETFYTNTRYIFFAHTLICDCVFLFMSDLLLVMSYFRILMPAGLCVIICVVMIILTFATPLTLTAMSVERYVAICMPLRHAEISTPHRALYGILVIHAFSILQSFVVLPIFVVSVPLSFYITDRICSVEMLIVNSWQSHLKSAASQFYFLIMSSTIIFTYIKILKAAKIASTDTKKKSTSKCLKTVILHGFQLVLSLFQLWCPFIEMAVLQIGNLELFVTIRYLDYLAFILAPKCLNPLIYGLRDDHFYIVLKNYAFCGLINKISPAFTEK
ncbi:odorant receptor 131-2-like [Brienomyrus brachyistius]|uniref:odorant receptor 131-2-like n=1 Tax=Brienomyrus brachyistius TaxID=42636 RepID=UPI0020B2D9FF|nr:odorant receptor 131-2-like [Brienomyrus brachyistius]